MLPLRRSVGADRLDVPVVEWPSLRLDLVSTPAGAVIEYRPTGHVVSVATGARRVADVMVPNAPPQHVVVTPGQVHILSANVPVGIHLFGPAENIVVTLSPRLMSEVSPSTRAPQVELRTGFGLEDGLIEHLVYALQKEALSPEPSSGYIRSLAGALAAHLVRKYANDGQPRSTKPRRPRMELALVLEYIEQNLDGRLTLPKLAEVARLSVFAFVRRFKTITGLPPHRYVLRKRVERAKVLLADAALNIADVALRCGFGDQSSFTTTFRRLTSQTPSAFRDTLRS